MKFIKFLNKLFEISKYEKILFDSGLFCNSFCKIGKSLILSQ